MTNANAPALDGLLVVELGRRTGASACASLLAQLGATVVASEPAQLRADLLSLSDKWNWRDRMLAGKFAWPQEDEAGLRRLCEAADAVIVSSDAEPSIQWESPAAQVVCDVTAWGHDAPEAPVCELRMQALTGILATTGPADGDPLPVPVPLVETLCGMHAAGAVLAALRHARRTGRGQHIDMALVDTGFAAMSSFFSRLLIDGGGADKVRRLGNRHTLSAPWNVYRASDGWILVCTGSDEQWRRLCALMDQPQLADLPRFLHSEDRVAHAAEVDGLVQAWLATQTVSAAVAAFARASIPGGPVTPVRGHPREPNLQHRGMVHPLGGGTACTAGSPFRMSRTPGMALVDMPRRGQTLEQLLALTQGRRAAAGARHDSRQPLAGVRVVEIGHYTTAPIAARHLAALGADVTKVEPPQGEAARGWAPMVRGQSVFYTVTNSDKRAVTLDLAADEGRAALRELLADADVLLENLKPGTLARHGFGAAELEAMNPRLVCCAISGFGADSIYAARPAFDTVVQGMSGLMDLVRHDGVPYKTGTSTADVMGASVAVVAVLAALQERERSGRGQAIDLSMQDIVAWATQVAWAGPPAPHARCVPCAQGDLLVLGDGELPRVAHLGREQALAALEAAGLRASPVLAPSEVVQAPSTQRRRLHFRVHDERGDWPALAVPLRLLATPPQVRRPGPPLGAHNDAIQRSTRQEKQEA
jgi:crotonobetainyl-CoA:carnitine CoA-transferase CaiB-like acyl-CoA transferase